MNACLNIARVVDLSQLQHYLEAIFWILALRCGQWHVSKSLGLGFGTKDLGSSLVLTAIIAGIFLVLLVMFCVR